MNGYEAWIRRRRLWVPPRQRDVTTRLDVRRYLAALPNAVNGERYGDSLFRADWGWLRANLRPHLRAIASLVLAPDSIIDLGCGDGLISCFYAVLFPNAEVIALDRCTTCLTTTRMLAQRLGLNNVRVVPGDATEPIFLRRSFDVVVAKSLVLYRVLHQTCNAVSAEEASEAHRFSELLRTTRRMLRTNGLLIATERWDRATDLWGWTSAIARAGFAIDWTASRQIASHHAGPRVRSFMVVARDTDSPSKVPYADVLDFLADSDTAKPDGRPILTGYPAEAVFRALHQRQLISVFEATRAGFTLRRELHRVGPLVISYDRTNWHERELSFWPRSSSPMLERQLQEEATDLGSQGWTILRIGPLPPKATRDTAEATS